VPRQPIGGRRDRSSRASNTGHASLAIYDRVTVTVVLVAVVATIIVVAVIVAVCSLELKQAQAA